ncbi:phospholipase-like protein [Tanacetum coccineum]
MYDNFQIQFGREEFYLVTSLNFGVEYSDDYDDKDKPIPFRRRVFPSCLDGKRITEKDVKDLIMRKSFKKLDDNDVVSLCCIGILQLVLLGLEDRRFVPNWILRLANDRDGWDDYPWGSEPTNEDDKKSYSLFGFTWAFKTWILEVFRLGQNEYYTRHMRYPRIVAWTSNKKFYRHMLRDFLHGRVPAERLIPDEVEAGSGVPSSFQTPTNNSIFNMGTPTNWQTSMPSQPGSSNWQSQMPAYTPTPNWQPPIQSHSGDAGLCDPNIMERPRRVQRPSVYMQSPYTPLPATTELLKKRVGRTKKNSKNDYSITVLKH